MDKTLTCFIVCGRMGKSLISSKIEPYSANPIIERIFVFSEKMGDHYPKVEYITLPDWIKKARFSFLIKLIRIIYEPAQLIIYAVKLKPFIINGYHIIPKGLNSLIASRFSNSNCIISLIGGTMEVDTYSRFGSILRGINIMALKKTEIVTTKGSVVNEYLVQNGIRREKIFVYNGSINFNRFYFNQDQIKDIDIVFAGTFRKLKGPDRVLKIISLLKERYPEIKCYLIGEGPMYYSSIELASGLGLRENVTFTGQVEDTSLFFMRSKVLVMPSTSEGLPTSMLEAMLCGCVPVISDVGNIRDCIISGYNGLLVDKFDNLESFADNCSSLLADDKLRSGLGINGINTVRQSYSVESQKMILDAIIRKLLSVETN